MDRIFPLLASPPATSLAFLLVGGHFVDPSGGNMVFVHFTLGVGTAIYLCALHTMVMFHFIGTGAEVREAAQLLGGHAEAVRTVRRLKARLFPLATLAMLAVIGAQMLGGGAHAGAVAGPVHGLVAWGAGLLNLYILWVEHGALRANTRLVRAVEDRVRELATPPFLREP